MTPAELSTLEVPPAALLADRLTFRALAAPHRPSFADDVRAGLTASPKTLPAKYFYDALGSHLFEAITCLPEYYLTRAETEILRARSGEIVDAVGEVPTRVVELGSGDAGKIHHLLDALSARHAPQKRLEYVPIDVSRSALERSADDLLRSYPGLSISAFEADFWDALAFLRSVPAPGRTLVLFLGSTIGNLEPAGQRLLLSEVRAMLAPGDAFLLATDLDKDAATLVAAYDDALGVTAAFNRNLLLRINRELAGRFPLESFRHRAVYDAGNRRIEMHLESLREQRVEIAALPLAVDFAAGETIFTESCYKFDPAEVARLAEETGFAVRATWCDEHRRFASNLLAAV